MYILALETTGKYGSAALCQDNMTDTVLVSSQNEMNHLKDIITISDEAIKKAGIKKSDLTHIACSVGPGSFTGIRIGVTTARTLSQMLGIPCISVSTLLAMAECSQHTANINNCKLILATINARRHQTYAGLWQLDENGKLTEVAAEKQYMIEEILSLAKEQGKRIYVTGDGIDAYQEIIEDTLDSDSYVLAPEELRYQSADSVAKLAAKQIAKGEIVTYDKLLPNYMRLAEAEQKLREGNLSKKIK